MKSLGMAVLMGWRGDVAVGSAFIAQTMGKGRLCDGSAEGGGTAAASSVTQQDLAVKVDGENAKVTRWAPFQARTTELRWCC